MKQVGLVLLGTTTMDDGDYVTVCKSGDVSWWRYPDVRLAGGLAHLVRWSLGDLIRDATLRSSDDDLVPWAALEVDARSAQVMLAHRQRLFLLDFWEHGVHLASGRIHSRASATKAMRCWTCEGTRTQELASRFPGVVVTSQAAGYEAGREAQEQWQSYLNLPEPPFGGLAAIVREAACHPVLRELFPFTSLNALCFSRCTGHPYTTDCPFVWVLPSGRYRVEFRDGTTSQELGAEEAVRLVVSHLPPNCGPAVRGTAEEIRCVSEGDDYD